MSPNYRHVPTGTRAAVAQRLRTVWASASTWYRLVQRFGWRRPPLRVHAAKPTKGLRTTRSDETWHIDTTVIRLLDGTRAYLHAVIDNFSRRMACRRGVRAREQRGHAARGRSGRRTLRHRPSRLGGCWGRERERPSRRIDRLRCPACRVLALTGLRFSNSMIEAWWRSLKHQWLFLHSSTASPMSVASWRSTSTNIIAYCRIRRFAATRQTRCTLDWEIWSPQTSRQARPPHDGPAPRLTEQRTARRVRHSIPPHSKDKPAPTSVPEAARASAARARASSAGHPA